MAAHEEENVLITGPRKGTDRVTTYEWTGLLSKCTWSNAGVAPLRTCSLLAGRLLPMLTPLRQKPTQAFFM